MQLNLKFISVFIRAYKKDLSTTIIKVFGLLVGFAISLLLGFYIFNELSSDKFHKNHNRIFRLVNHRNIDNKSTRTTANFMDWIEINYPEVKKMSRLYMDDYLFQYQKNAFKANNTLFVDSSFLEIFTFPLTYGDKLSALDNPYSIILTESLSKKIFNGVNPIGKTIQCDNKFDLTVTGVIKDFPDNSSIQGDALISFVSLKNMWDEEFNILEDEGAWAFDLFLLLNSSSSKQNLENKLSKGLRKRFGNESDFRLQEFNNLYFDNDVNDRLMHGNLRLIYILIICTFAILLFASVNYINLSTATSISRSKEVVINKILGATRQQQIYQFILESIFVCIFSFLLALIVVKTLEPLISNFLNIQFDIFHIPKVIFLIFITAVMIGFLSGIYPSYIFSSYKSLNINIQTSGKNGDKLFKNSLTLVQFCISVILICFTIHIYKQSKYMKSKSLGCDIKNIINIKLNENLMAESESEVFKDKILQNPAIEKIALSNQKFGDVGDDIVFNENGKRYSLSILKADPDFLPLMDIKIIQGRNFSWDQVSDITKSVWILNREAVRYLNWDNPLEKKIYGRSIVGIVENFHYNSLHEKVQPLAISCYKCSSKLMSIKTKSNTKGPVLNYLNNLWNKIFPNYPFEYSILEDSFKNQYKSEDQLVSLLLIFSIIAIYIALLGLYSVSFYLIKKRTNEISIRKTFGAKVNEMITMLSSDYIKLALIANILSWPLAYLIINRWLQNYPYSIEVDFITFLIVGIISIIIAVFAVLTHIVKISNKSIAETIKYE